jgi:hypothetical protein
MAREKFEDRTLTGNINVACKFDDGSVRYWTTTKEEVVQHIRDIVSEYSNEGYILTLRQLHYQFVKSNWIVNHDTAYKKLGSILDDCRYGGVIDWDAIEDRGRVPYIPYSVDNIEEALNDILEQYRIDRQDDQENHIELWTEKDALSGILRRTTQKYHVKLVVNKGYTSSSAIYNAYERVIDAIENGQKFIILYFGDHDPSGLDMVRDIRERLLLFLTRGHKLIRSEGFQEKLDSWWDAHGYTVYDALDSFVISEKVISRLMDGEGTSKDDDDWDAARLSMYIKDKELFQVIPIGLTMEQIVKYNLPPNPTKITDSRADKYVKKFGKTCWEVDALNPKTLTEIVERHIQKNIDMTVFKKQLEREKKDKETLKSFIDQKK